MTESKKKRFARLRLFRQFYDMQARAESAESECSALTARLFFAEGEVQRLHAAHNQFVNEVSGDVVALPFALRKVEELEAEIARLRKLGIEQCENTTIHSVNIEGGAIEVLSRPPHWAIKAMADSFFETLDGAPNWRAIEIGPLPGREGNLIVTVCRASGDSPVETCTKLKNSIEELLAMGMLVAYAPVKGSFDEMAVARARALLNPEKKD